MTTVQKQREALLIQITEMNTNLCNFIKQNAKDHTDLKTGQKEQNGRIRKTETKIAYIVGMGSAVVTVLTVLNALGVL